MKSIGILAGIAFLVFTTNTYGQTAYKKVTSREHASNYNIPVATLADVGINNQVINELVDSIESGFYPNRHSLLIYKNDKLVLEKYFSGKDAHWGKDIGIIQYNDTVLHDMRSISKSVVSACMGIAIAQGKIKSVDQPIFDFFEDYKQYKNEGREKLTIKHLLTMTTGLEWNERMLYNNPENTYIKMIFSEDGLGFVLSQKLVAEPGTVWNYNGGATLLLAEIIHRASGKDIHEFAKEFLFRPIGIEKSEWTIYPSTNSPAAASGLRLTSKGILRFGILYQNGGSWGEKQIIPKEWTEASFRYA